MKKLKIRTARLSLRLTLENNSWPFIYRTLYRFRTDLYENYDCDWRKSYGVVFDILFELPVDHRGIGLR